MLKWMITICLLVALRGEGSAQAYLSMPSDSAVWRYRIFNIDYFVQVLDNILFVNGQDTAFGGHTFRKIISRTCIKVGGTSFDPPIKDEVATTPDTYYGGIRDSAGYVYFLNGSAVSLIYNFNAHVGDYIPAPSGTLPVVSIDSVLLGGRYHRRFFTSDTTYYVIEGVGSSVGLVPDLAAGSPAGIFNFYCFTDTGVTFAPNAAIPCTFIYPLGFTSVSPVASGDDYWELYPVPATNSLYIHCPQHTPVEATIVDVVSQTRWRGTLGGETTIQTANWPKGMYYLRAKFPSGERKIKGFVIE
jgi:hypothetical protein